MHRLAKIPVVIIGALIVAVVMAFVFGIIVKALWNWLMPEIFGLPEVTYWQAWGLLILGHILLGGDHVFKYHRERENRHDRYRRELRTELVAGEEDAGPEPVG